MKTEDARFNMIEQQIRPTEVLDQKVLDILADVPREAFVPTEYKKLAFADINVPIGYGQVMMTPIQEAHILQALDITHQDTILEIGTGSGFLTACLARLGKHVYSVEIVPELSHQAGQLLHSLQLNNVSLKIWDGLQGWKEHEPYDVIVITGSLPLYPENLAKCLRVGGRMVSTVGESPVMECCLTTCMTEDTYSREVIVETDLPSLQHAPQPKRFVL